MPRPTPVVLMEAVDPLTYKAEQILEADATYAIFFRDKPINIRLINKLYNAIPKYKKTSYQNGGSALCLARKLNKKYGTNEFVVKELISGNLYTGHETTK